jgi:hypothetical protein
LTASAKPTNYAATAPMSWSPTSAICCRRRDDPG